MIDHTRDVRRSLSLRLQWHMLHRQHSQHITCAWRKNTVGIKTKKKKRGERMRLLITYSVVRLRFPTDRVAFDSRIACCDYFDN